MFVSGEPVRKDVGSMKLTATFGTASLLVLQQVQSATSLADGSPLPALPEPSRLLFGVHPELLGVASIHLESKTDEISTASHVQLLVCVCMSIGTGGVATATIHF